MARPRPVSINESPLVPLPTNAYIPQRDLDKSPILEVSHLGIDFGGLTAVNDLNLTVGRTEIAGLIGPNGAGKTTVFKRTFIPFPQMMFCTLSSGLGGL